MDNDKILNMFRKILGFDEMECLQIPNMEMGNNRRAQLKEARNYLIGGTLKQRDRPPKTKRKFCPATKRKFCPAISVGT